MENLNRILHIQMSFDDLLKLFAGGTFFEDDLHSPNEICIDDNQFVFAYSSDKSSRLYWIDPTTLLIQKNPNSGSKWKSNIRRDVQRF